jgi:hypothetical protein
MEKQSSREMAVEWSWLGLVSSERLGINSVESLSYTARELLKVGT